MKAGVPVAHWHAPEPAGQPSARDVEVPDHHHGVLMHPLHPVLEEIGLTVGQDGKVRARPGHDVHLSSLQLYHPLSAS